MNGKALPHSAGVALSYQVANCLKEISIHAEVKNLKDDQRSRWAWKLNLSRLLFLLLLQRVLPWALGDTELSRRDIFIFKIAGFSRTVQEGRVGIGDMSPDIPITSIALMPSCWALCDIRGNIWRKGLYSETHSRRDRPNINPDPHNPVLALPRKIKHPLFVFPAQFRVLKLRIFE